MILVWLVYEIVALKTVECRDIELTKKKMLIRFIKSVLVLMPTDRISALLYLGIHTVFDSCNGNQNHVLLNNVVVATFKRASLLLRYR